MKRDYILEKLTQELLQKLKISTNPYKDCKQYLNMALDIGTQTIKMEQMQQPRRKAVIKMTMLGTELELYPSVRDAAYQTGIPRTNITNCCKGKTPSAGGYKWKYKKT